MFAHSQGLSYTNPHIVDRPPEISWRPTNRKEKITDLPPSLNVRLWRERASVGIAVHCQIRVVVPQGFRLTRGFQKGHIEFWKIDQKRSESYSDPVNLSSVSFISYACSVLMYVFSAERKPGYFDGKSRRKSPWEDWERLSCDCSLTLSKFFWYLFYSGHTNRIIGFTLGATSSDILYIFGIGMTSWFQNCAQWNPIYCRFWKKLILWFIAITLENMF